jgi:hypothetical protein
MSFFEGNFPYIEEQSASGRMISFNEIETFTEKRKRLGWRFHAILLSYVAITASISLYVAPNLFYPICALGGGIGLIVWRFWMFSRHGWFWMALMAMIIIQVPLVGVFRDFAARWKWDFGFGYSIAACIAMDYVIRWIAPNSRRRL